MFARLVGAVTAVAMFFLYLHWYEGSDAGGLLVGLALAVVVGIWTCRSTENRRKRLAEQQNQGTSSLNRPDSP